MSDQQQRFFVYLKSGTHEGGAKAEIWNGDQKTGSDQFKRGPVGTGDLLDFMRIPTGTGNAILAELEKSFPYVAPAHYYNIQKEAHQFKQDRRRDTVALPSQRIEAPPPARSEREDIAGMVRAHGHHALWLDLVPDGALGTIEPFALALTNRLADAILSGEPKARGEINGQG